MGAKNISNVVYAGKILLLSLIIPFAAQEKDASGNYTYDTHNDWSEGGFKSKEQLAEAVLKIRTAAQQESIEPIRDMLLGGDAELVCLGSKFGSDARFSAKVDNADYAQRIWSFLLRNDSRFTKLKTLEFEHVYVNVVGASTYKGGLHFKPKSYQDRTDETDSFIKTIVTGLDCESEAVKRLGLKQVEDSVDYSIYDTHNRWSYGGFDSKEQLAQAIQNIRAAAEQESIEPIRDMLLGGATTLVCWGSKSDRRARFTADIEDADHAQQVWAFLVKNDGRFIRLKTLEFEHVFVNWKGASTYRGGLWINALGDPESNVSELAITAIITSLDCESAAVQGLGLTRSDPQ